MHNQQGQEPVGPGPEPMRIICPSCREAVLTTVEYRVHCGTHCVAILLCCCGCWCCACLPYCLPMCLRPKHFCPNCGEFIGPY